MSASTLGRTYLQIAIKGVFLVEYCFGIYLRKAALDQNDLSLLNRAGVNNGLGVFAVVDQWEEITE